MTLRLAGEITLTVAGERICLRPTLRAATRLERQYGGFSSLANKLLDGSVTAMIDVLREGSPTPLKLVDDLNVWLAGPVSISANALIDPLVRYVALLVGVDPDAEKPSDAPADSGERMSYAEYHERLFRIATGWLGWSPDQAWNAAPSEILAAYQGRQEMLVAIFGSGSAQGGDGSTKEMSIDELKAFAQAGGNLAF